MEIKYPFFKNTSRTPRCLSALQFETVRASCEMAARSWLRVLLRGRKTQLLLVNMLTCGLEICMATGTTCVPPLLLEAGIEEQFMTMVLGKASKITSRKPCVLHLYDSLSWNTGTVIWQCTVLFPVLQLCI